MKKFALLSAVALLLSSVSVGCSTDGLSSFCRTGSLFSPARPKETTQYVYTTGASSAYCNPCEPVSCAPCEPVCNPCEPLCDPCVPRLGGIYSHGITPGPMN